MFRYVNLLLYVDKPCGLGQCTHPDMHNRSTDDRFGGRNGS